MHRPALALLLTICVAFFVARPEASAQERSKSTVPAAPNVPPDPAPDDRLEQPVRGVARTPRAEASAADVPPALPSVGPVWVAQGPGPIVNGQTEGISSNPVVGAAHVLVAHPTNADIIWMGAANGGIWKTTNATNASPTWTAQTDSAASLSIGALERDPTDGTHNTLVAGIGKFSSLGRAGGPRTGVLRTTNGGTTWTALSATMSGRNIAGIAARGATIVAAVDIADSFTCSNIGIWRSTDTGASFTIVSGGAGSGLPSGRAFDIAGDPTSSTVLYTAIRDGSSCAGTNGVYRSADTGATWTKVSNSTMDALMLDSVVNNTRIAVGNAGQVYVGIVNNGRLAGLFRSATSGASWTQLDTPTTTEGGTVYGMQPREKPGAQGGIHFSIVADPTNANLVYVGGDRQPGNGDTGGTFPNSIGATNYTGRLFRVNAAATAGTQATPLTHCATATAACGGVVSTTSNSAPHADSRRMVFDANGNIVEADDGGVYRRTNPTATGDWFSVNGNLQITEAHDVAYDGVSNLIISGNQDTGTSEQTSAGSLSWSQVSQGDGGDIAIDDSSSATQSIRYSSFQNLSAFRRRTMNASGAAVTSAFPALAVTGGGSAIVGQFTTPVAVNTIDPARILFGGALDLYESLDRGDTITALGLAPDPANTPGRRPATALVYGGMSGGVANASLIYAICPSGTNTDGPNVFVRTSGAGAPVQTATSPGTAFLRGIVADPTDWQKVYVINSAGQVWSSANAGATWANITGDLSSGTTDLRSMRYVPGSPAALLVGGMNGVFRMAVDAVGVWNQFGTGLPNAPVWDMDYDVADDVLVASTLGRGVWKLSPAANLGPMPTLSIGDVTVVEGNAGSTNAVFTVTLSAPSTSTVSVKYATADATATGPVAAANETAIVIPGGGNATPYPSTISVAGATGTITGVSVSLTGLTHAYLSDVDVLLVGPGGQSVILLSDVGPEISVASLNFTFDDAAAGSVPAVGIVSGSFKPTNVGSGDTFPSPAPASGYGSTLAAFNGQSANGTWSLFIVDDEAPDGGSLAAWSLTLTTTGTDYVASSGTATFAPGTTTQTISVPVSGDTAVESNETFVVNLTNPALATLADAQGVGTITNDDGPATAPAGVVATAATTTSVSLTWTAAAGAASYRVYRSSNGVAYALVGSPATNAFTDVSAAAATSYLYKVRAFSGSESGDSNIDLATTVIFTDPVLSAGTIAKLAHFAELMNATNALRTLASLSATAFSAPAPSGTTTLRAQHLADLRTAVTAARSAVGLPAATFAESVTAGVSTVKASHLTELRDAVK